jgi:hypothetical protein
MSITRPAAAVALLTGLSLLAAPAQAQYYEQSTWITPFAGIYFGGSLSGVQSAVANSIDVGESFTYGARLGHKFNSAIGLVFEYAHADPSVTIRGGTAAGETMDLHTNIYEGTFNFYFGNDANTQGYIALGGGADNFSTSAGGSTQFGGVFGLGGQKFFNEKWAATLDGRYRWVNVNGADSYYCGFYGCYAYDTSWYGSGEITLGVTYKFK